MEWKDYQRNDFPLSEVKKGSPEYEAMEKAAKQGYRSAQYDLGMWNEMVAQDYETALDWYKRAADQEYEGAAEAYDELFQKTKKQEGNDYGKEKTNKR